MNINDFQDVTFNCDEVLNGKYTPKMKFVATSELKKMFSKNKDGIVKPGFLVRGLDGSELGKIANHVNENNRKIITTYVNTMMQAYSGVEIDMSKSLLELLNPETPSHIVERFFMFQMGIVKPEIDSTNKFNLGIKLNRYFHNTFLAITDEIKKLSDAGFILGE